MMHRTARRVVPSRSVSCRLSSAVPAALEAGSYWVAAQFQNMDGSWVTATPISGGGTENPWSVLVY